MLSIHMLLIIITNSIIMIGTMAAATVSGIKVYDLSHRPNGLWAKLQVLHYSKSCMDQFVKKSINCIKDFDIVI